MNPQPSEHAMRLALKFYRECAAPFGETVPDDDAIATKFADDIDTHAIEPATRELREQIAELKFQRDGIHSCHDQCQRPICVLQRRVAELERENAELRKEKS